MPEENRMNCTIFVLLITLISVAILLYSRKKKSTPSLPVVAAPFPDDKIKPVSHEVECLAYFKAGDIVHVSELSPLLELSPPTLNELLKKSYADPASKVQYDGEMQSFIVPEGMVMLISKDRRLHFMDNPIASQLVSTVRLSPDDEFTRPVGRWGKGSSVDIETLPRPTNFPLEMYERMFIEHLDKGYLDGEYQPDTQILKIESGGMEIDQSGTIRFYRMSEKKKHLNIKIVKSEQKAKDTVDDSKKVQGGIRKCPECKRDVHGPGEFCPGCGAMMK